MVSTIKSVLFFSTTGFLSRIASLYLNRGTEKRSTAPSPNASESLLNILDSAMETSKQRLYNFSMSILGSAARAPEPDSACPGPGGLGSYRSNVTVPVSLSRLDCHRCDPTGVRLTASFAACRGSLRGPGSSCQSRCRDGPDTWPDTFQFSSKSISFASSNSSSE